MLFGHKKRVFAVFQPYGIAAVSWTAYMKCFLKAGHDTVDAEKMKHLFNQHRMYHYWILKDNVFSMIKLSATIQRIDKQLLSSLYDCYDYMDTVMDMGEKY